MDRYGKKRIAHHEAGHAVIARVLGVDIPCVSIVRMGTDAAGTAGALTWSAAWTGRKDPATMLAGVETDAKITFAGPNAELKYLPDTNIKLAQRKQWRSDMERARSAALKIVLLRADPKQQFEFEGRRTVEITSEQDAEVERLVNQFNDQARLLVEQHWPAIGRVAAALLDRRIVYGDKIDALIAG
jgi:ATP-dependent Zn protease